MDNRGRVLLVGENSTLGAGPAQALAKAGFQAETASGGAAAMTLARQRPFDVVVCDLKRPGTEGLRLVKSLRAVETMASFVLLSDDTSNELAVRAAELGVLQVLRKPVDPKLLERAVAVGVDQVRHAISALRSLLPPASTPRAVPATDAKNEFGNVLDEAVGSGAVIITKRDAPKAVLVSYDRLSTALARHEPDLTALSRDFDALVASMQTPKARAAGRSLFSKTPAQLGQAALNAATPRRG